MKIFAFLSIIALTAVATGVNADSMTTDSPTTSTMIAPTVPGFTPLPAEDKAFSQQIAKLVKENHLDEHTPADQNPDNEEEWSSICVVNLADIDRPVVGGWEMENFVYPASTYKMYVLGEAIRRVCAGTLDLDQPTTVSERNYRGDDHLAPGQVVPFAEILRQMCMYSNNTAANIAIDTVDRKNATKLMESLGCRGSDIMRKYLSRTLEDAEYTSAPGTVSNALHFATFLWATETGAIGGGRGRGLIKGFLGTIVTNNTRSRVALPKSCTVYSKTGEWDTFSTEAALVEDGKTKFIVVVMTAMPIEKAGPRMAGFMKDVYDLVKQ